MSSIFSYSLRPAWTASDEDRLEEDDEEEDGCVLTPMLGFPKSDDDVEGLSYAIEDVE